MNINSQMLTSIVGKLLTIILMMKITAKLSGVNWDEIYKKITSCKPYENLEIMCSLLMHFLQYHAKSPFFLDDHHVDFYAQSVVPLNAPKTYITGLYKRR